MFSFTTIEQYHQELLSNKTSCVDIVHHYINLILEHQHLNAFVEVYSEEALLKAQQLDQKRKAGHPIKKLHGVVIALKDVICYKDHKVSAASAILQNFISSYSATAVQFLLDEEAIIIGNCNCDEFAMGSSNENSYYGNVLNAIDHSKVSGGSSGGSAVAVQANLCMISLGSDTGGSVRQPADFCGIIGLKPSYGKVSRFGLIAYASSFDQIGIFGKTIEDVALVLQIISQPDVMDSTMNTKTDLTDPIKTLKENQSKKYRIGFFKNVLSHNMLDKEIAQSIHNTISMLKNDGHDIIETEFELIDFIVPTYYVLTAAEASSNLSRYDGIRFGPHSKKETENLHDFYTDNRTEGFGKEVKRRIMLGNFVLSSGYYEAYFNKAQKVRKLLTDQTEKLFSSCDIIIMPTSPTPAFKIGEKRKDPVEMYLSDIFTVFANLTGIPAISIPLFRHSNGMPYGIQLHAKRNDEDTLLSAASILSKLKRT